MEKYPVGLAVAQSYRHTEFCCKQARALGGSCFHAVSAACITKIFWTIPPNKFINELSCAPAGPGIKDVKRAVKKATTGIGLLFHGSTPDAEACA